MCGGAPMQIFRRARGVVWRWRLLAAHASRVGRRRSGENRRPMSAVARHRTSSGPKPERGARRVVLARSRHWRSLSYGGSAAEAPHGHNGSNAELPLVADVVDWLSAPFWRCGTASPSPPRAAFRAEWQNAGRPAPPADMAVPADAPAGGRTPHYGWPKAAGPREPCPAVYGNPRASHPPMLQRARYSWTGCPALLRFPCFVSPAPRSPFEIGGGDGNHLTVGFGYQRGRFRAILRQ